MKLDVKVGLALPALPASPVTLVTRVHAARMAFRVARAHLAHQDLKASEASPEFRVSPERPVPRVPWARSVAEACKVAEALTDSPENKEIRVRKDLPDSRVHQGHPELQEMTENPGSKGPRVRKDPRERSDCPELRVFPDCRAPLGLPDLPGLLETEASEERLDLKAPEAPADPEAHQVLKARLARMVWRVQRESRATKVTLAMPDSGDFLDHRA